MPCSTCATIRRALNAPLQRLGLPTLPMPPAPVASPAQRPINPAWPTRRQ